MDNNISKRVHVVSTNGNQQVSTKKKRKVETNQQKLMMLLKISTKSHSFLKSSIENASKLIEKNVLETFNECSKPC